MILGYYGKMLVNYDINLLNTLKKIYLLKHLQLFFECLIKFKFHIFKLYPAFRLYTKIGSQKSHNFTVAAPSFITGPKIEGSNDFVVQIKL